jgi:hypothetical protein
LPYEGIISHFIFEIKVILVLCKDPNFDPESDCKAFNMSERQVVMELYERMSELRAINEKLKERKADLETTKAIDEE